MHITEFIHFNYGTSLIECNETFFETNSRFIEDDYYETLDVTGGLVLDDLYDVNEDLMFYEGGDYTKVDTGFKLNGQLLYDVLSKPLSIKSWWVLNNKFSRDEWDIAIEQLSELRLHLRRKAMYESILGGVRHQTTDGLYVVKRLLNLVDLTEVFTETEAMIIDKDIEYQERDFKATA